MQRITRTRLAELLNHPHSIPSKVVPPNLDFSKRKLAEVESIQKLAVENNLELVSLRKKLAAAKASLASIGSEYWPSIRAEVDLGVYSRELGANDLWRAGVILDVPLYQGGRIGAKKAQQISAIGALEARLRAKEIDVRNAVLETWLKIENIKLKVREMQAKADYRELYLDRARALYEMEVKTDLGDAMVKLTQASLDSASVLFEQALAWEKMKILTGGNLEGTSQ
jgi:outer membrane protein TolC